MSPKELGSVKSAGDAFAEITTTMAPGVQEPVCIIDEGIAPETADDSSLFFVAKDADPFVDRHLATIGIEGPESDDTQLVLFASERMKEKPRLMGVIIETVLEEAGVEHVQIDPENTNVSTKLLEKLGAVAVSKDSYLFNPAA